MSNNTKFQRWFLPGFVFQSVIIGGGYATGRELVEFFLSSGPTAGLVSMLIVTVVFSLALMVGFELSRMTRTYDYRTFMKQLLGRGWFLFEILFLAMALLILAVLGAASGELVSKNFGLDPAVGTVSLLVLVGILVFWGTSLIEKALAGWSMLLYVTYGILIVAYLSKFGSKLPEAFASSGMDGPWALNSVKYVGYTIMVIPMILFVVRHMESRRDAFIAGAVAGPIGMIPAIFFYLGMVASYPEILEVPVPADHMMHQLSFGWLSILFYIVVFGTFVETGTALIHGINERIDHVFTEKSIEMPQWVRPAVAVVILLIAILLAGRFGLIDLIARGYGSMAWGFLAIVFIPLMTIGIWRITRKSS